jgi:23S rRNA pseudouridine2605 synthase
MRINRFVASATGLSRRVADLAIQQGHVLVNSQKPTPGHDVTDTDIVTYRGTRLYLAVPKTILLNKPAGYVVSRDGQGSKTIYDLLPPDLHTLKPIGRLDKDSSGLLLMTTDGQLSQELTHPKYQKTKVYEVTLDKPLQPLHRQMIGEIGIQLDDGLSRLGLDRLKEGSDTAWRITMREGRNRQIRRTFAALGYNITKLHRTNFGNYALTDLESGAYRFQA